MTDRPWMIRPYRPGDELALAALFGRVFGRPIDPAFWRWKLKSLPAPAENVWLAEAGDAPATAEGAPAPARGAPVFQYAGIPLRFSTPAGETTAMISVDTMTAPEFRRRGLLTSVGRHAYEQWRAGGVGFVLGLPNDQWGSRTGALSWRPLFPLRWLIRPLRPETLLARKLRLGRSGGLALLGGLWNLWWDRRAGGDPALRLRLVDRPEPAFDRLWERCRGEAPLSVIRDSAWVGWRYLAAPCRGYRVLLAERDGLPAGYVAYRLEPGAGRPWGMIAELTAPLGDAAARRALLA
ncbi:MAG TPA: GNAT family N-acetyltransferase, partial [Herpetosiphonaceae bacterium]